MDDPLPHWTRLHIKGGRTVVQMKERYTIVIVTHNMQQAARISDYTGFFLTGDLVEFSPTQKLFSTPEDTRTENYITGRFG